MQFLIFCVCTIFIAIGYLTLVKYLRLQSNGKQIDNEFTREAKTLIKLYKSDMDSAKKFKAVGDQLETLSIAYDRLEGFNSVDLNSSQILHFERYKEVKKASSFK